MTGTTRTHYNDERLLSVRAVCDRLSVSRQSVYRLVADGSLPVVKIRDRTLFRPSDIEALIERTLEPEPSTRGQDERAHEYRGRS
jgi:excisionase family DNA binding protein